MPIWLMLVTFSVVSPPQATRMSVPNAREIPQIWDALFVAMTVSVSKIPEFAPVSKDSCQFCLDTKRRRSLHLSVWGSRLPLNDKRKRPTPQTGDKMRAQALRSGPYRRRLQGDSGSMHPFLS